MDEYLGNEFDMPEDKDEYEYLEKGHPEPGQKVIICEKHPELTKIIATRWDSCHDATCVHYGNCSYCIMETEWKSCEASWEEEYDNWDEVVCGANSGPIKLGYKDFHRSVNFLTGLKLPNGKVNFRNDVLYFRQLYKFGYEYAKKGYDLETLNILMDF